MASVPASLPNEAATTPVDDRPFPGEATITELIRAAWRATPGSRLRLATALVTSVALFALLAVLPLAVGRLLDTALSGSTSDEAVDDYLSRRRELVLLNGRLLGDLQATRSELPLRDIDRGMDLAVLAALAQGSESLLDALFDHVDSAALDDRLDLDLRQQLDGTAGTAGPARALLADITSDGVIERDELETLIDPRLPSAGSVSRLGLFDQLVTTIALDERLGEQRDAAARDDLRTGAIWFIGAIALAAVLRQITVRLTLDITQASGHRLRRRVFAQIHDTAVVDAGVLGRPSMVSRCTSYVDRVEAAWRTILVTGIPAVASLVLSLGLLWWTDRTTGAVITATVVLLEILRRRRAPSWSAQARERLDRGTELAELTDLAVSQRRAIWARADQGPIRTRFLQLAEALSDRTRRVELNGVNQEVAAFGVGQLGLIVVVATIGLTRSDIGLAAATASVLYVGRVADALARLPGMVADLAEAAPYQRRLDILLDTPARRPEPLDPVPAPDLSTTDAGTLTVDVVDLVVAPPGPAVPVTGCSLRADARSWTILVGPPGSGASTITGVLGGLDEVAGDMVFIAGGDTSTWSRADLRRFVTVIPANPALVTGTWRDQLTGPDRTVSQQRMDEVLVLMGLGGVVADLPDGLDTLVDPRHRPVGAEVRARVAAAAAILDPAPVVVIEDPTAGLDHDVAADWWTAIRRGLEGRVVIVATSRRDVIRDQDQIAMMMRGRLVEHGRRPDLIAAHGAFSRWWEAETGTELTALDLRQVPGLAALDDAALAALGERLVTERYDEGEVIIAAGAPLDRLMVVADGLVELLDGAGEHARRIALVRPGNQIGEVAAENVAPAPYTARALEATVVRSLHRLAISDGVAGVLDRPRDHRRLYTWLLRRGETPIAELMSGSGPDLDQQAIAAALEALLADGSIVAGQAPGTEGSVRVAGTRRRRRSGGVLDQLVDRHEGSGPADAPGDAD